MFHFVYDYVDRISISENQHIWPSNEILNVYLYIYMFLLYLYVILVAGLRIVK